ncbi:hypothetical protein [Streptomyces reniochalinae]|uniref:Uncharacterized protein n=1 Tax=Streptomyces reniochalinae TaxID=2250578 RepID=A0A367F1E1_9ACTN|nr:hypothetical protein [Streptomyces reniochalinae]RCG24194.1 hypothetical protein DQ392_03450 [Streptomyces reniochalinae]
MSEPTDRLDPYELAHELAVADQLAAQQISADRDGARAMAARDQAAARRQGRPAPPRASTERRRSGAASRMVRAVRELRVMLRGADGEEHRPGPPEQGHAQQAAHQPDQPSAFERYQQLGAFERQLVEVAALQMITQNPQYAAAYDRGELPVMGAIAGEAQARHLKAVEEAARRAAPAQGAQSGLGRETDPTLFRDAAPVQARNAAPAQTPGAAPVQGQEARSAEASSERLRRPALAVRTDEATLKRGVESEPNARRTSLASTGALVADRPGTPGFDQNAVSAAARKSRAAGPKPNGNPPRGRPPKQHWEAAASQKQAQSRGMK